MWHDTERQSAICSGPNERGDWHRAFVRFDRYNNILLPKNWTYFRATNCHWPSTEDRGCDSGRWVLDHCDVGHNMHELAMFTIQSQIQFGSQRRQSPMTPKCILRAYWILRSKWNNEPSILFFGLDHRFSDALTINISWCSWLQFMLSMFSYTKEEKRKKMNKTRWCRYQRPITLHVEGK